MSDTDAEEEEPWTNYPQVLLDNWTNIVPKRTQPRVAMANSLARLSIVLAVILSLAFRSLLPFGLGALGLYLSSRVISAQPTQRPRRNKRSNRRIVAEEPEPEEEESPVKVGSQVRRQSPPSWRDMFGSSMDASTSNAMGAYVGMANTGANDSLSYFVPEAVVPEGTTSHNLVPLADVEAYRSGEPVLRTPFPRAQSEEASNVWKAASPYQSGYPTEFGPAPSPASPRPSDRVLPSLAAAANEAIGIGAYQPSNGPVAFGMFESDGGYTSSALRPAVPHGTAGQNFPTQTYQPHHFAEAGEPLRTSEQCFTPNADNPLGNPEVFQNRVARPPLCTANDPRSGSTQFVDSLYESTAQQGAAYNFFPFPVQDVVQTRDNYQDFVIKSGLTHYKDKYSNPEDAGRYNFTDFTGEPLGY